MELKVEKNGTKMGFIDGCFTVGRGEILVSVVGKEVVFTLDWWSLAKLLYKDFCGETLEDDGRVKFEGVTVKAVSWFDYNCLEND